MLFLFQNNAEFFLIGRLWACSVISVNCGSVSPQNSYGYWACPKTVEAVECAIAKTEAEPPMYNYANIIYHNCAGQAAAWVEAGGLLAPYPASYPFLHPAPQGIRVFFIGRGSVLYRKTPAESIVGKNYNPLEH